MKSKKYICKIFCHCGEDQKKEWRNFWFSSDLRHTFNSPDFFTAYCESYGHKKYAVVFCYEEGCLCGVLPLVEDCLFGIKVFSCPGRKGNCADKNAILVREHKEDVYSALLSGASKLGNLYLAELDERFKHFLDFYKTTAYIVELSSRSCYLLLSREKSVLEFMPAGQKKTLFRRIRQKEKDLEFRLFKTDIAGAFETVMEIEKGSYKRERRTAFFDKASIRRFFKIFIEQSPQNIHIGILYFKKRPAAAVLGFVYGKTFAGYHTAFLKEHRSWGAGKAVIYFTLEHLKKEGFIKADLLRGSSELKRQFSSEANEQYNFYFSKRRVVLYWWKICVLIKNALKSAKEIFESSLSMFKAGQTVLSVKISGRRNRYYKKITILFAALGKYLNMPAANRMAQNFQAVNGRKKPVVCFSSYDGRNNPYYSGGGASAVHEVAKRLAPRFEVHVLAGKYPDCLRREFLDGVHYERIGSSLLGPKLGHLVFHAVLPFHVFFRTFDLWIESFTPPFSTSFLPFFTKKPVIGLVHMLSAENMRQKYKIPFNFLEDIGIKMYDNFIVLTEQTKNKIKKLNPGARIEIIPNGVESSFSKSNSVKKHFLFIGRIEINQKGLDLLLESFSLIAKEIDYPFIIAGQGVSGEEKKLVKMIRDLKISDKVKFVSRIEGAEKIRMFREAAAVIIPSRFETFSLVALEALAYGVPIVSFDIEGLKWLPESFSSKVRPFDTSAMAEAIKKTLKENAALANNDEEIKIFLKNYDWKEVALKFEKYLDSVLILNK